MSLSVKEILNIGKRHLEEAQIADAAIDCKLLYCYLMNITSAQLILEYQKILPDRLCDEYFALLDRRAEGIPLQYITCLLYTSPPKAETLAKRAALAAEEEKKKAADGNSQADMQTLSLIHI